MHADDRQIRKLVVVLPLGLATLACLASLGHVLVDPRARHSPLEWLRYVQLAVLQWYYWAAIAPLIVRLGDRFPIWRPPVWRALGVHIGAAVAASFGITSVVVLIEAFIVPAFGPPVMRGLLRFYFTFSLFADIFIYLGILGVAQAFRYQAQLQSRELESKELRAQLDRAYVVALQSQMQPHFVLNALHATGGLIRSGRNQDALTMVVGLGNLLRSIVERRELLEVSLRDEITLMQAYLHIQQMRFGKRLRTEIAVEEDALGALVPTFILQPLLENAIEHGIERKQGTGLLRVKAWREEQRLVVTVYNDGPPIAAGWRNNGGTGLANAGSRLHRMFGGEHLFAIDDVEGGVQATVRIPWRLAAS